MTRREERWHTAVFVMFAFCCSFGCWVACASAGAQKTVVTVADVVNQVAKRGDQVYAVSVQECDAAEKVAVELPDVGQAGNLVKAIRAKCDVAFKALDSLRLGVNTLDEAVARAEKGQLTAADLASAAVEARRLYDETVVLESQTADFLKGIGK